MRQILGGALIVALAGVLLFLLSTDPDADRVGWALFIVGIIVAAVIAVIIALSGRSGPKL